MTKRAVLYARGSGDDRGKEGRNLAGQLEMCRNYAQERGYQVVAELAEDDRGASGASLELPQLTRLLDMATNGGFDVLVAWDIDRLSRDQYKQAVVEHELKRDGVQIEYVLYQFPDTPEGRLHKSIHAGFAQYEREKTRQRTVRARRRKVKAGHALAHGKRLVSCGWSSSGQRKAMKWASRYHPSR